MHRIVSTQWFSSIYGSLFFLLLLLPVDDLPAQSVASLRSARGVQSLPGASVRYSATTGFCTFVQFDPLLLTGTTRRDRALAFLTAFGASFGFQPAEHTLIYIRQDEDVTGGHHLLFHQWWRGRPTVGGELRFHFDFRDRLTAVSGLLLPAEAMSTEPALEPDQALALAHRYFASRHPEARTVEPLAPPRLVLFRSGLLRGVRGRNHLAYAVTLSSATGEGADVYLDAHTGNLLESHPTVYPLLARRLYKNSSSPGDLIWTEGDPFPGGLLNGQAEILTVSAHFYQLLSATFGRDSYDDQGAMLRAVYNPSSLNCIDSPNANWNGNTANFCPKVISDDVIAHEWGHALIESTSNLIYAYQPGALNESFCDILGEVIDLINAYGEHESADQPAVDCTEEANFRWRIGEDTAEFFPYLRDMWDPTCQGDPGKTSDPEYYCGEGDDGGVHSNSGINNHAFALLVDGGTYNGTTVPAIGLTKATHLFFLAQTAYLHRYSDFSTQADALEAAAGQLIAGQTDLPALTASGPTTYSGTPFTEADSLAVVAAIAAVEMRNAPDCPERTALFSTPTTGPCGSAGFFPFYTEDFEAEAAGWISSEMPQHPDSWDIRNWSRVTQLPHSRAGYGYFAPTPYDAGDCLSDLDNGIVRLVSPPVTLPPGTAGSLKLTFDQVVALETRRDGGRILLSRDGGTNWSPIPKAAFLFNGYTKKLTTLQGNPYVYEWAFTGTDEGAFSSAWATTQVDLSGFGLADGDTFQLAWDLATDAGGGLTGWWIDNIQIGACTVALPVTWLSFTASAEDRHVTLEWATAREVDNTGFRVERLAEDGRSAAHWETLGWVPVGGTGDTRTDYRFLDHKVTAGVWYYYRLRQVDADGTTALSPIAKARLKTGDADWQVFPNPVSGDYLQIRGTERSPADLPITIYDLVGKVVARQTVPDGQVDVRSLPPGVYLLAIEPPGSPPALRRFVR